MAFSVKFGLFCEIPLRRKYNYDVLGRNFI